MKRLALCLTVLLVLLLTGCNWMDGNFYDVTPHEDQLQINDNEEISASTYPELKRALEDMVDMGKEKAIIYVGEYNSRYLDDGVDDVERYICENYALGAYAVEDIHCEVGASGGKPAVSVTIRYLHGRSEIRQIQEAEDMQQVSDAIYEALETCQASLTLRVGDYSQQDIGQLVEDYAMLYPQRIMEIPQVTVGVYPDAGKERILEIKFVYQNSRDTLREMQSQVASLFEAAELYVGNESSDSLKMSRLYGFITGLGFDFQLDTSLTPAYSLLRHGVGDSKAIAVVYAAMCRQAGLECQVITGTQDGEPHYWNIVRDGAVWWHVDVLRCQEMGGFRRFGDGQMGGYVWDYSAYPVCPGTVTVKPEETTPPTETGGDETQENTENN